VSRRERAVSGAALLALLFAGSAHAQMGLTAASGTTSLLSSDRWTLSADLMESAISLTAGVGKLSAGSVEWFRAGKLTLAADKGSRDLYVAGDFVPGGTIELRVGRTDNFSGSEGGFSALYASASYDVAQWSIAEQGALDTLVLSEKTGSTLALGLGAQFAPTERVFQATGVWNHDVPTAARPSQVAVIRQMGVDAEGNAVVVTDLSDRYVGPTADSQGGTFRLDFTGPRWDLTAWEAAPNPLETKLPPTVAILAAVSVSALHHELPVYDFAIGPGVFAPNRATGLLGAILFELTDFTNASGENPHLADQLGVRLHLGLPWGPMR
jgi:hypothetical protein